MGNCLFSQGADDLSLLNDSEGGSLPGEPPPPYQEQPGSQVKYSPGSPEHDHLTPLPLSLISGVGCYCCYLKFGN